VADRLADRQVAGGRWPKMFISLSEPQFRAFVLGMLFTYVPMTMQMVTTGYLAYLIAGRATDLGLVAMAWGVPGLALTLFAGVAADRYDRRSILLVTQLLIGFQTVVVALLIQLGLIQIWHLVVSALVQGTLFAFNMPARQGALPDVVPERYLANAVAVNNSFFNVCRIVGPALAGVMIAIPWVGMAGVYYLMGASFILSSLALLRVHLPRRASSTRRSVLVEIGAGFRYIWSRPALWVMILMAFAFVGFGMPYANLLPVYAVSVLGVDSAGLGILMTAQGIGALIGSLALGALAEYPRKALMQLAAAVTFGVLVVLLGLTASFPLALALMVLVGGAGNLYMSLNNTLLMLNSHREFLGRVMSVYMFTFSIMPLMVLPFGASADLFGVQTTLAAQGIVVVLCMALIAVFAPRRAVFHDTEQDEAAFARTGGRSG
jgi:MFS family permease